MALKIIKSFNDLRSRVDRFLLSKNYGRPDVRIFLDEVTAIGRAAIFGGMLRDISIMGNLGFDSDVDIVVEVDGTVELQKLAERYSAKRNNFGGFRIRLRKWQLDVWPVEETWARANGHIDNLSIENIYRTTFFDWDAIAFDLQNRSFFAIENYIERINSRVLDINLQPNPNQIGNAIRALRYCEKFDAALTRTMAEYVFDALQNFDAKKLVEYENSAFEKPVLTKEIAERFIHDLGKYLEQTDLGPFRKSEMQTRLFDIKFQKTRRPAPLPS